MMRSFSPTPDMRLANTLEVYSQLALREAQQSYDLFMKEFPL